MAKVRLRTSQSRRRLVKARLGRDRPVAPCRSAFGLERPTGQPLPFSQDRSHQPPLGPPKGAAYTYSSMLVEFIPLRTLTTQAIDIPWICGSGICYDAAGRDAFVLSRYGAAKASVLELSYVGFNARHHAGAMPQRYSHLGTGGFLARTLSPDVDEMFVDATLGDHRFNRLGYIQGSFGSGWGSSAFTLYDRASPMDENLFESVLYRRAIEPGDVLAWTVDTETPAFGRIGPRGGFLPFNSTTLLGKNPPTGLGRAADGRLCATYGPDGNVTELIALDSGGVPTKERAVDGVSGAVSCLYDGEDHLVVLADKPARLITFAGDVPTTLPLAGVTEPRRIVRSPSNAYRITTRHDTLACLAADHTLTRSTLHAAGIGYALDGRLLVVESGIGTLRALSDAEACSDPGERWGTSASDIVAQWAPGCDLRVGATEVLQRPDSRVVLQLSELDKSTNCPADLLLIPLTWNPANGRVARLSPFRQATGGGLVLVPGGTWCDPWADVLPAGESRCYAGANGNPDGGTDGKASGTSCGCRVDSAASGSSPWKLVLGLLAIAALGRRLKTMGGARRT